jgi:hypothetical protein
MLSEAIEIGPTQQPPKIHSDETYRNELPQDADERLRQLANVVIELFLRERASRLEGTKGWVN